MDERSKRGMSPISHHFGPYDLNLKGKEELVREEVGSGIKWAKM